MDLQLRDGVAVVVGGAHGIGAAIVDGLLGEGASTACLDIATEDGWRQGGDDSERRVFHLRADVTDFSGLERCRDRIEAEMGPVRRLVVAAGAGSGAYGFPFWNLRPEQWPEVFDVNLHGAVRSVQAFAPAMRRDRDGAIVLFTSVAAQIGSPTDPPYSAAKAALANFGVCAARDLAPYNVRVNLISPGMVQTALNRSVFEAWRDGEVRRGVDPESLPDYATWGGDKVRRVAPLGRWQTPQDMAAATLFLLSPLAANITGQTLNVDGGQVMRP